MTQQPTDKIYTYFRRERLTLLIVTLAGVAYNVGLVATPWFEGKLAQVLCDIIAGKSQGSVMLSWVTYYVITLSIVQVMRYAKRFYVRRFGNNVNRSMKRVLYRNLTHMSKSETDSQSVGALMTKAISDVDTCAEGMRKFTTEVFDTGVVIIAYGVMLLTYDPILTLIACAVLPVTYFISEKLKVTVSKAAAKYKAASEKLSGDTLDRVEGALSYRVLGADDSRNESYDKSLHMYEKTAVVSGILENAMQPLYHVIAMASVILIIWFGAKNVLGSGMRLWDIAAFTTYLSCYARLALKSAKAAKLFNSVQKASVSWARIKPLMTDIPREEGVNVAAPNQIRVNKVTFTYPNGSTVLRDISFSAEVGQIIGVTGHVACGKSTLGKLFLCEHEYVGQILFGDRELYAMTEHERRGVIGYMGHDTELMSDTVRENVLFGNSGDVWEYLRAVCIDDEVRAMSQGENTIIGTNGMRLSGGQQARIALARTLCHKRPIMILDDPFAALDRATEAQVMTNLREMTKDCVVILISHRLYMFPHLDKVVFMADGQATESTHSELMRNSKDYRELYEAQSGENT